ncbi:adenosine kinase [Siccirubricoccus sp. KC 17139]|uniref:Adenosine kinase n=1 Tax=Siccirubricoccus soli TaxID=2899147 RepID=A0ABT1D3X6_9PROT|nr:adenosine kinase [Siccirubricoccus soli]MCO6416630.1 adenosine kinase [Siccirubricoccus soli]MCP2682765.1 adenosine kinase [Siccirubricoccus soli]
MSEPTLDILGIGNAIVDVLARADDAFLDREGLAKGAMRLIGAAEAEALYAKMGPGVESSGGSAGNTCAVAAALGARVGFLGKVADDALGQVFAHDIRAAGVHFPTPPLRAKAEGFAPTARCLILVTPDAQRTMNTFLGACVAFSAADVDPAEVARAKVLYLEGYLFDPPAAQAAFHEAARLAHAAGRQVAITLSDAFCVVRHRQAFRRFLREEADIVFANEAELLALYETEDFAAAARQLAGEVGLAAVTRSERGSLILAGEARHEVPAAPVKVVDTTGAGDAYAAGFLAALTRGLPLPECGRWGSVAAAEVISHFGARPQADLQALVAGTLPPGARPVADTLG